MLVIPLCPSPSCFPSSARSPSSCLGHTLYDPSLSPVSNLMTTAWPFYLPFALCTITHRLTHLCYDFFCSFTFFVGLLSSFHTCILLSYFISVPFVPIYHHMQGCVLLRSLTSTSLYLPESTRLIHDS